MGLDMYAYTIPKDDSRPSVDFEIGNVPELAGYLLHCWHKHPNLHGWMAGRYYRKGGTDPDFLLNTVELTPEDIDELESAILKNRLPETSGPSFGQTTGEEREDDIEFIRECRDEFAKGRTIAYTANW